MLTIANQLFFFHLNRLADGTFSEVGYEVISDTAVFRSVEVAHGPCIMHGAEEFFYRLDDPLELCSLMNDIDRRLEIVAECFVDFPESFLSSVENPNRISKTELALSPVAYTYMIQHRGDLYFTVTVCDLEARGWFPGMPLIWGSEAKLGGRLEASHRDATSDTM